MPDMKPDYEIKQRTREVAAIEKIAQELEGIRKVLEQQFGVPGK